MSSSKRRQTSVIDFADVLDLTSSSSAPSPSAGSSSSSAPFVRRTPTLGATEYYVNSGSANGVNVGGGDPASSSLHGSSPRVPAISLSASATSSSPLPHRIPSASQLRQSSLTRTSSTTFDNNITGSSSTVPTETLPASSSSPLATPSSSPHYLPQSPMQSSSSRELHSQPSFSDARRLMMQGKLLRREISSTFSASSMGSTHTLSDPQQQQQGQQYPSVPNPRDSPGLQNLSLPRNSTNTAHSVISGTGSISGTSSSSATFGDRASTSIDPRGSQTLSNSLYISSPSMSSFTHLNGINGIDRTVYQPRNNSIPQDEESTVNIRIPSLPGQQQQHQQQAHSALSRHASRAQLLQQSQSQSTSTSSSSRVPPLPDLPSLNSSSSRDPTKPHVRTQPHLHTFTAPEKTSAAYMHWSRAPVHGSMPNRAMRAHTMSLVEHDPAEREVGGVGGGGSRVAWLFGGTDEKKCYNDVWCLDLDTLLWTHPNMQGEKPPPCRAHSATVVNQQVIIFGGGDGSAYYNHLWVLDTRRYSWRQYQPYGALPPPRRAHTCVYYEPYLIVFGGGTGSQALGDMWALDLRPNPANWEWELWRANPNGERVRRYKPKEEREREKARRRTRGVGAGPDEGDGMGGGEGEDDAVEYDDCYETAPRRQLASGDYGPPPRGYHTANVVQDKMIIVGGSNGNETLNDVWMFDLVNHTWQEVMVSRDIDEPPRMLAHSASVLGFFIFFIGGHSGGTYTNDLRLLNTMNWKYESKLSAGRLPPGRGYHTTLYADNRIFLVGGYQGTGKESFQGSDVWVLDLASQSWLLGVKDFTVGPASDEEGEVDEQYEDAGEYVDEREDEDDARNTASAYSIRDPIAEEDERDIGSG
ncbi:galactose oxidase [Clavulina sp. PMI_390]|nr:galactose oxidase [Clavulina sp. PMI_390]